MENRAPQIAVSDEEILACFGVMQELRPHLQQTEFVSTIRLQQQEGYRLAYIKDDGATVVACAGYRVINNLASGKTFYVDDLVTSGAERALGYGSMLLNWLKGAAASEGCSVFHLDSGVQRHSAHKFYFKNGLNIVYYHFSQAIEPPCSQSK